MVLKIKNIVALIIIFVGAISCSAGLNDEDIDVLNSQISANLVTKVVNLTVIINDSYNGQFLYKIDIFNDVPTVSNSVLLKSGVGSRDLVFSSKLTVVDSQSQIYIRQTDPTNKQTIKQIALTTSNVVCDFR